MVEPIVSDLRMLETTGLITFDAHLKQDVLIIAPVLLGMHDNPRSSEVVNHMGSAANLFCRMCIVSCIHVSIHIIMYHLHLFHHITYFNSCDKRVSPHKLGRPRSKVQALTQISLKAPEHERKLKQSLYGIKDNYNPLFQLEVDLYTYIHVQTTFPSAHKNQSISTCHRSTPVECLHTILLGHLFGELMERLTPDQKREMLQGSIHFLHLDSQFIYLAA